MSAAGQPGVPRLDDFPTPITKESTTMKRLTSMAGVVGFALALSTHALFGLTFGEPIYGMDENGIGTFSVVGANFVVQMPYQFTHDPSGGIAGNVLIYRLESGAVTPGDVALLEPGQPSNSPSDLLRFFSLGSVSYMILYSDIEPGEPLNLADTGLPASPNAIAIPETGQGGEIWTTWSPSADQPGSLLSGGPVAYSILNDVPEPVSGVLTLCGLGMLLSIRGIRKDARSQ